MSQHFSIRFALLQLTNTQTMLFTLWVLVMVSLPVVDWSFGWDVMVGAINLGVLAQAAVVLAILWGAWGWARTVRIAVAVAVLSWATEALGSSSGFPFTPYTYTGILQPQLFNIPLLIPLAWLMMLPPSWAVGSLLCRDLPLRRPWLAAAVFSGMAMTAWDLFLDPQMTNWGLWVWQDPCCYFGTPWSNFLGWFLASTLISALLRPADVPILPLLLVYTATWLLESAGLGIFWSMPGPALSGFVTMGFFTVLSWRRWLAGRR